MIYAIIILSVLYLIFILTLIIGWYKGGSSNIVGGEVKISVVIPVRNEEENIGALLGDLMHQNYHDFEVIVVNDHSTDRTEDIVKQYVSGQKIKISLITPKQTNNAHKKNALKAGIDQSTGEYIVTTDGDCRIGQDWLMSISGFVMETEAKVISGPVVYEKDKSIFKQLQVIEFASLIGTGAACMNINRPNMCNGANFTFSKEAFYEVNGYDDNMNLSSGDDEFLMQKIHKRYPGKVSFLKDKRAIVTTASNNNWKELSQQRKRWASKWNHHNTFGVKFLAVFVFLINLSLIPVSVLVLATGDSYWSVVVMWSIKLGLDFVFLVSVLRFLGRKLKLHLFLLIEVFHIFYVVIFGIKAQKTSYIWKEREVR